MKMMNIQKEYIYLYEKTSDGTAKRHVFILFFFYIFFILL